MQVLSLLLRQHHTSQGIGLRREMKVSRVARANPKGNCRCVSSMFVRGQSGGGICVGGGGDNIQNFITLLLYIYNYYYSKKLIIL